MTGFASFLSEEQRREYEAAFPSSARTQYPTAGPSSFAYAHEPTKKPNTRPKKDKGKAKAHEPVGTLFTMDEFDEDDVASEMDTSDVPSPKQWKHDFTPPSSPEPQATRMAPPSSFFAPLRTSLNLPIRGHKDAPKTFKGKHTEVQRFIDHYDRLLSICRVTEESEKCEFILEYCSTDVQNVIHTMESYSRRSWKKLRKEILKFYDAE
jgi:hypothetical protein